MPSVKPGRKKKPTPKAKQGAKTRRTKAPGSKRWWPIVLKLGLVALVIGAGFLFYLDIQVTAKFEGKRWELPAKVYARPLELYAGKALSAQDLEYELQLLGYRRNAGLNAPGEYYPLGNRIIFYRRGFLLWDEELAAQRISVSFAAKRIDRVQDNAGEEIAIARLEPYIIGGIYPGHGEDRVLIRLSDAPKHVLDALIAVEDQDYYRHHGVSPKAILRAAWVNTKSGRLVQGGSTLTQQLVKNFYLSSERTLRRKGVELFMSLLLELHYDKQEILEAYLNEVYLGQAGNKAIHGFGLASQHYFGITVGALKLHQAALLAALVKGPSYYNPRRHPARALARRNLVLDLLVQQNVVSEDAAGWAKRQPLDVTEQPRLTDAAYPAYMDLVQRQLQRDYKPQDLTSEGLRIFTSLDPIRQRQAETSLQDGIARLQAAQGRRLDDLDGALVLTSVDTGEVLALVGGKATKYAGFNRALDAQRPVGSVIKPAVYLTALMQPQRYQLNHLIDDSPISLESKNSPPWQPRNFDRQDHGMVPLHSALANSYNQATARLGLELGVGQVLATLDALGVERKLPDYPAVLLGAGGLAPIEVAAMYQTIAAGGFSTPLRAIQAVTNAQGEVLTSYGLKVEQRFNPAAIHLLQYALQEAMREGTGKEVYGSLPADLNVAGKTGSTDDLRDSWFAGFTGDYLAVVWLGKDDNTPMYLTGSKGALPVWVRLMQTISPQPLIGFVPENVTYHWIDDHSGLLSAENCEGARYLPFINGSEPVKKSNCVSKRSGLGDWIKSWFGQ